MFHKKDGHSSNPRFQCSVCAKWMRLFGKNEQGQRIQRSYGGCGWNGGNDHLAGDKSDVCSVCCDKKCKEIGTTLGIKPLFHYEK